MVIERVAKGTARVAGTGAGSFFGGLFNNPGVVIILIIIGGLFIFRDKISEAFGGLGDFELPTIELPTIEFPSIDFPDIQFPSFDIDFPDISTSFGEFGSSIQQQLDDFFSGFGGGEFGSSIQQQLDDFFSGFGGGQQGTPVDVALSEGATAQDIEAMLTDEERALDPNRYPNRFQPPLIGPTLEELFPDQPVSISDFVNRFVGRVQETSETGILTEEAKRFLTPSQIFAIEERGADIEGFITLPSNVSPFAVPSLIVEESQEGFQERARQFVEENPELTRSTSLPGSQISFGEQLSRESEDFQEALDAEARRAEQIFQALFGDVQNPNF